MRNTCQRCNYSWSARSETPTRCPRCKSTRWNRKVIRDKCMRCNAEWIQRGDEQPKYCPVCHSTMWNYEKKVYTCPKCGKTRALRSNSRTGLCPDCDMYVERRQNHEEPLPENAAGIRPMIHLWGNGKGLALYYLSNGRNIAFLLDHGRYVGEINIESFFRTQGHRFIERDILEGAQYNTVFAAAAEAILSAPTVPEDRVDGISNRYGISVMDARIIEMAESGMPAISISLKLGIPYDKVRAVLDDMPVVKTQTSEHRYSRADDLGTQRFENRGRIAEGMKE